MPVIHGGHGGGLSFPQLDLVLAQQLFPAAAEEASNVVLHNEGRRYNALLDTISTSLQELAAAVAGGATRTGLMVSNGTVR